MRPSLRFLASFVGFATICAAASLTVVERQKRERARVGAEQLAGGSVDAGKRAIERLACGACHRIQGIDGADGRVGPPLNGIALRTQLAGRLSNEPANMIRWIRSPQDVDPGNAMPNLPINEREARDIATYLYTLASQN